MSCLFVFFLKVLDCRLHSRSTLGQFPGTKIDSEKRYLIPFIVETIERMTVSLVYLTKP